MTFSGDRDPEKLASREVGETVDAFNTRMRRRLKERELQEEQSHQAAEHRHQRMLHALTVIRKALSEAAKVSFNDRFGLAMRTSDWEGWPRMDLVLTDELAPGDEHYGLTVTAHDRRDSGTVQLVTKGGECLARLYMGQADALGRLPLTLKSALRKFLDQVSPYVLNPPDPEQILECQTKALSLGDKNVSVDNKLSAEEFFVDENYENDALISEIDVIPLETNND